MPFYGLFAIRRLSLAAINLCTKFEVSISNRLMLNPDKSEAIWCTTSRRQHQLPTATIPIVGVPITPARSVRNLGIYIDADLSMRAHVNRTVSPCFAERANSHIPDTRSSPIVHSLLDYGNAVLVGIPTYLVRRLQSVLNAAARLIYHLRPHDHITDALATLHWLRVSERVQYKIAVLT